MHILQKETCQNTFNCAKKFEYLGHESRVKAAQNLVKLINTYDAKTAIYIIGHSHGGNVATLASQLLAQEDNRFRIRALFTLGTPIMSTYYPNMSVILYLYNLFSFEDLVQTVLGISDREFPEHRRIANMQVYINGVQPDHSGLHHPLMGKWIAYLHKQYKSFLEQNGILHRISDPSIMYLAHDKEPEFKLDNKRQELLDRDRRLSMMMLNALRNTHRQSLTPFNSFIRESIIRIKME